MIRLLNAFCILAAIALLAAPLGAADYSWNTASGYVSDAGNWNPAVVPGTGTGDNVTVQNGGIAMIDLVHQFGTNPLGNFVVGNGAANGAVVQTGGAVVVDGGFVLGSNAGSYGYYSISDGSLTINSGGTSNLVGDYGSGVFSQTGGSVNMAGNGYMILGWHTLDNTPPSAPSVMSITGGNYSQHTAGNSTYGILVGWGTSSGVLNIGGTANVNLAADYTSGSSGFGSVLIGNGDTGFAGSGIMNLGSVGTGGGTLTAGIVRGWYSRQSATVNFHGGTLVSSAYAGELSNLDHAYVYSEGAIFDIPKDKDFNIYASLETPDDGMGQGISEITLVDAGSGYIGEPVVTITPASGDFGTGATARAILNSSGGIDHIEITNPGVGYTLTPTISITGGSGTAPTLDTVTLANNVSGGLTKKGAGVLYMNADSTYTGATTVETGTLYINKIAMASSGIVVKDTATLAGESSTYASGILPATTVEAGGKIAPGAVGRILYINSLNLADGAILDFKTATGGTSDRLEIVGGDVLPSGTTGDVVVTVNYDGTVNAPTQLLLSTGYLSPNVLFQLPAGLPKLDSQDGINTPVSLVTSTGYGGTVTLVPGGAIADPKWNVFAGGSYDTASKWDPNTVPNGGGQRALFTNPLGAGTINVSLDTSPQLSSMVFDSPTGESYKITPTLTNSITLDSTIAQNWHISVLSGTHEVGAKLKLQAGSGESAIRLADNSKLTLSGVLDNETTAANVNVEGKFKSGDTLGNGIVVLSGANTYTGKTTVKNAVLEVKSLDVVANANTLGQSSIDPANLVLTNSTLRYSGTASGSTDRGMTLAGANVKFDTNSQVGFGGKIVTTDTPAVTKTGSGTWTFNNPTNDVNDFGAGTVTVTQGTLAFSGGVDSTYTTGPMIVALGTLAFSGDATSTCQVDYIHVGDPTGGASTVNQSSGTVKTDPTGYVWIGRPSASGVYNLTGGKLDTLSVYTGGDGNGVLKVGGTAEISALGYNFGYTGAGAGYQTGGTVNLRGGGIGGGVSGDYGEMIGVVASGYYKISGGTINYAKDNYTQICLGYADTAPGLFEQTGGAVTASNSSLFTIGMNGIGVGSGTMNLSGGTFTSNNDDWGRGLNLYSGIGVLNIAGTSQVDLQGTGTTRGYIIAGGVNPQVVNVGGTSVVKAGFIKGWDTPTNAVINFHGGTIVARESTDLSEGNNSNPASFMNDWNHAYVYSEGVKLLVEEGHTSTISQVFEDPTGKGLSQVSVSVSNGGSGYISPPLVTITGGGGNGATAYATLDSAGHVNGIVISNPGTDYTSAPTFTLLGGGGIDAAIAVDDTKFAQNVGGSLEKLGPGELTLTGASTRTGDTVVNDGTLNVTLGINTPNALVYVATGGTLNTPSIVADTLSIGGEPMGAAASAPAAVPEPGMFALLALAFLGLGAWLHVGRK